MLRQLLLLFFFLEVYGHLKTSVLGSGHFCNASDAGLSRNYASSAIEVS